MSARNKSIKFNLSSNFVLFTLKKKLFAKFSIEDYFFHNVNPVFHSTLVVRLGLEISILKI